MKFCLLFLLVWSLCIENVYSYNLRARNSKHGIPPKKQNTIKAKWASKIQVDPKQIIGMPNTRLRIGSFNIQSFGTRKMNKPDVVDILWKIINRYDIIMIQEIRDVSKTAFPHLVNILKTKTNNPNWNSIASIRLGRNNRYQEQYGFIYRENVVQLVKTYQYPNPNNLYDRPPFVANFKRNVPNGESFNYLAIHAKPARAVAEIDGLVDVYNSIPPCFGKKTILGGDFNAACRYVRDRDWPNIRLSHDPRFTWIINGNTDTTVSYNKCAYDRFVVAGHGFAGKCYNAGVFNFSSVFNLNYIQSKIVSDHYPIEFELA